MTCVNGGAGVETDLGGLRFCIGSLAPANELKSTSTSARSAGASTIRFALGSPGTARCDLYNLGGALVRSLDPVDLMAGQGEFRWDGRDGQGRALGAGTYYARLISPSGVASRAVTLLR